MRPRFMNRGSASGTGRAGLVHARFNEAPIHESGKCHARPGRQRPPRAASMRPRFMNRGSAVVVFYLSGVK